MICVRAQTRDGVVACPGCGAETARVRGYHERTAADGQPATRPALGVLWFGGRPDLPGSPVAWVVKSVAAMPGHVAAGLSNAVRS